MSVFGIGIVALTLAINIIIAYSGRQSQGRMAKGSPQKAMVNRYVHFAKKTGQINVGFEMWRE